MADNSNTNQGIRLLIQKCRSEFRQPENIHFYSENGFKAAEKKYVKYCLTGDARSISDSAFSDKN